MNIENGYVQATFLMNDLLFGSEIKYNSEMSVSLVKHNISDLDVARAAWVSNYGEDAREKDSERVEGLIRFLYREQHMSPFEHGGMTLIIKCPIFVAREFHRHRTWSYNEVSGRYKEMVPEFYLPARDRPLVQQGKIGHYTFVPGTDEMYVQMIGSKKRAIERAWREYQFQLELGVAREVARDELPLGLYTVFYASANLRNIMQFLTLRLADNALYEIRQVAQQIESQLALAAPLTYKAYDSTRKALIENVQYKNKYDELTAFLKSTDLRDDEELKAYLRTH